MTCILGTSGKKIPNRLVKDVLSNERICVCLVSTLDYVNWECLWRLCLRMSFILVLINSKDAKSKDSLLGTVSDWYRGQCLGFFFGHSDKMPDKINLGEKEFIVVHKSTLPPTIVGRLLRGAHVYLQSEGRIMDVYIVVFSSFSPFSAVQNQSLANCVTHFSAGGVS